MGAKIREQADAAVAAGAPTPHDAIRQDFQAKAIAAGLHDAGGSAKAVHRGPDGGFLVKPYHYEHGRLQGWAEASSQALYHAAGLDPKSVPRDGTHHNALDDALHQVRCVQRAHEMIQAKVKA